MRCTTTPTTPQPLLSSLRGALLKVGSFHRPQSKQRRLSDTIALCLSTALHASTVPGTNQTSDLTHISKFQGTLLKAGGGCRRSQDCLVPYQGEPKYNLVEPCWYPHDIVQGLTWLPAARLPRLLWSSCPPWGKTNSPPAGSVPRCRPTQGANAPWHLASTPPLLCNAPPPQ